MAQPPILSLFEESADCIHLEEVEPTVDGLPRIVLGIGHLDETRRRWVTLTVPQARLLAFALLYEAERRSANVAAR